MIKAALYIRVSTQEQATEGYSVGEQTARLKSYCAAKDWTVVKIYTDPGWSGGNINRPGLQALIKDVRHYDVVVVYKLDRLSRNQKDTMSIIEDVFMKNKVSFVSMNENFDMTTPLGMAMIGILSSFAQLERSQIQERMKMGKEGRVRSGKWHGGSTQPIGYDYNPADQMLHVNEYEAMQIRELYSLYLAGTPIREIERIFLAKGYHHKHGVWDPKQMRRTMHNATNIGKVRHLGNLYPGLHEPIIDEETFNRACQLLDERYDAFVKKKMTFSHALLGGMIYCKRCGGRYHLSKGRAAKNGIKPKYYTCYSRDHSVQKMIKDPNCKAKNWKMDELDNLVFSEIRKLVLDPDGLLTIADGQEPPEKRIRILQDEIDRLDGMISRYLDLYALNRLPIEMIDQKITPLQEQKDSLLDQIETIEEEQDNDLQASIDLIMGFGDILEKGDFGEIRMALEQLIDRIDIGDDDITIHWKFQ